MQSKLPQMTLAQIWALSDMDSDGRLGCEEFVLAMYLCDMVKLLLDFINACFNNVYNI